MYFWPNGFEFTEGTERCVNAIQHNLFFFKCKKKSRETVSYSSLISNYIHSYHYLCLKIFKDCLCMCMEKFNILTPGFKVQQSAEKSYLGRGILGLELCSMPYSPLKIMNFCDTMTKNPLAVLHCHNLLYYIIFQTLICFTTNGL